MFEGKNKESPRKMVNTSGETLKLPLIISQLA